MWLIVVSLFVLLLFGIPIAYSIAVSSFLYFAFFNESLIVVIPQRIYDGLNNPSLLSLPLFILLGGIMNSTGITQRLIDFSMFFVGKLRGGLSMVNVIASMIFGGISGSSASDTASIGAVLIPEMKKRGYSISFSSGVTVASSTMGMIIPPSVPMVLFAIVAQQSVGRLFLGGLIPGIMIGTFQLLICAYLAKRNNLPKENTSYPIRYIGRKTLSSFPVLVMPWIIVGSVTFGIVTPTESAAIGVLYAILIGLLYTRQRSLLILPDSLVEAALTSAKIMVIIAMSQLYIWVLALERLPDLLSSYVLSLDLGPIGFLLLFELLILIAGTFIDVSPAILLFTPVFLPIAQTIGVDPVHFGVVFIVSLAVGACTPPVGTCLNICSAISKTSIGEVFKGALPFLVGNILTMLLIVFIPELVMAIPNFFFN